MNRKSYLDSHELVDNKKKIFNETLLMFHEENFKKHSLYKLYLIKNKIYNNNNFIVEKINNNIINTITKLMLYRKNGKELLEIIEKNNIIYKEITAEEIDIEENVKLLKLYNNLNKMEELMNLKKDSLFNAKQHKNRLYLRCKLIINNFKTKCMLCEWY